MSPRTFKHLISWNALQTVANNQLVKSKLVSRNNLIKKVEEELGKHTWKGRNFQILEGKQMSYQESKIFKNLVQLETCN